MRLRWGMLAGAVLFACASSPFAAAQVSDIVPPRPKALQGKCAPPPPQPAKPVCCLLDIDLGADGKTTAARSTCSDPAFEEPTSRCQGSQTFSPATRAGQPVPFTVRMRLLMGEKFGNAEELCSQLSSKPAG